jgi:hypothetical protein
MSTQAVSSHSLLQELQGIRQDLQPGRLPKASDSEAQQSSQAQSPAFVVTINASQGGHSLQSLALQQDFYHQRATDLKQLGQDLQSGDAAGAQQAYDALTALGTSGPLRNGQTFRRSGRAQDFAAIGQALASGDLAGATSAFASLSSTFRHTGANPGPLPLGPPIPAPPQGPPSANPPHIVVSGPPDFAPPPAANPGTSAPPEIIINVGGANQAGQAGAIVVNLPAPSTTPEEVQINFGGQQSAGGQIQIDLQAQSGGGETVSINLNGATNNSQLVLNLFQGASSSAAPQSQGSLSLQA